MTFLVDALNNCTGCVGLNIQLTRRKLENGTQGFSGLEWLT